MSFDFESVVVEKLEAIDTNVSELLRWQAGQIPVCEQHAEDIKVVKEKISGNGRPGIDVRLDRVERVVTGAVMFAKRAAIPITVAVVLGFGAFALHHFQESDNVPITEVGK